MTSDKLFFVYNDTFVFILTLKRFIKAVFSKGGPPGKNIGKIPNETDLRILSYPTVGALATLSFLYKSFIFT